MMLVLPAQGVSSWALREQLRSVREKSEYV
ncbi:Uncharacterised protein [Vibrio cholerae]|nr:Uncharacterised protein [Vibrio cholerae]